MGVVPWGQTNQHKEANICLAEAPKKCQIKQADDCELWEFDKKRREYRSIFIDSCIYEKSTA